MKFKLRAFCKDTKSMQDIKDYSIKGKELTLISDFKDNKYNIEDTDYVVVYKETLEDILNTVFENGKKSKVETKPKKQSKVEIEEISAD